MGFLMGAYGKIMAGKLVRDIQDQMTSVQSRLRRVTREIGDKEKMYAAQERNMKQQMQSQQQMFLMGGLDYVAQHGNILAKSQLDMMMGADPTAIYNDPAYQAAMSNMAQANIFSTEISSLQQKAQMQATMANNMWQNVHEMEKEADLQSLKDLEGSLQVEKDNLESRLKIAQGEYEAYKDEEKQGAPNLKADYTGQG